MRCSSYFLLLVLLSSWAAHEAYAQRTSSATQTVMFAVRRPVLQEFRALSTVAGGTQDALLGMKALQPQRKVTATVPVDQESFRHVDLRDEEENLAGHALSMNIASVTVTASTGHRPFAGDSNLLQDRGLLLTVTD